MDQRRFWPFLVSDAAQDTAATKRQIAFFDSANQEGHKSFGQGSLIGALATNGREGEMIPRGGIDGGLRRYWEVILSHDSNMDDSFYVDGFENATEAVLKWLRGDESVHIRSCIGEYVVQKPGQRGW